MNDDKEVGTPPTMARDDDDKEAGMHQPNVDARYRGERESDPKVCVSWIACS